MATASQVGSLSICLHHGNLSCLGPPRPPSRHLAQPRPSHLRGRRSGIQVGRQKAWAGVLKPLAGPWGHKEVGPSSPSVQSRAGETPTAGKGGPQAGCWGELRGTSKSEPLTRALEEEEDTNEARMFCTEETAFKKVW